ncbi:hypothetical protein [Cytophaga hutchinsonii]|jgi:hypothetical protein|uniref:Uncharacterized protein n=1 Tax=Cytophaga hutchinsonii (strain ATCC 33406 / DSM 1761 / CIP 103989 / NBRC 15051 / NCIMB 9469 / D465) TaxID=269798 RepID=A0A6N4SW28_CYTH3|nr:hypothetical protein [Cytophaga hutchinsonii]ABG60595.1 hypothetical protein CHU_3359 [Cytophaga hutchinsonii ATCC 33406]SFX89285.1 hypothetical protein SAMN04487930_11233 [Cytophaga hutchinsonii ATCC 33406]
MDILDSSEIGSESVFALTNSMKKHLTQTAKWGKFLAIVGFVGIGFILIGAFTISMVFEKLAQMSMGQFDFNIVAALTFFYLLMAILWFVPVLHMFNFSTRMLKSIPTMDIYGIEKGLSSLNSLFKFYGIFTLIILGLYALALVFAVAGNVLFS